MYEYNFYLNRVIDGDSIEGDIDLGFDVVLSKQYVRLSGIDAPEISRVSHVVDKELQEELKAYGKFVSAWLDSQLMGQILRIRTEYDDTRDKYGRILGTVIARDPYTQRETNINEFMVDSQLAVAYNGGSRAHLISEHLANMRACRDNGFFEVMSDTN